MFECSAEYVGCFNVTEPRSFNQMEIAKEDMTRWECEKHCFFINKLNYAAMTMRNCSCGSEEPIEEWKEDDDKCNEACPGDTTAETKCGGVSKVSVWRRGSSSSSSTGETTSTVAGPTSSTTSTSTTTTTKTTTTTTTTETTTTKKKGEEGHGHGDGDGHGHDF